MTIELLPTQVHFFKYYHNYKDTCKTYVCIYIYLCVYLRYVHPSIHIARHKQLLKISIFRIVMNCILLRGFPGDSAVKNQPAKQPVFIPGWGRFPGEGFWKAKPVFLPREFHGQRSLADYNPLGCRELDTTEGTQHARTCSFADMCTSQFYDPNTIINKSTCNLQLKLQPEI